MAPKTLPDRELARQLLDYNPATGVFTRPNGQVTGEVTYRGYIRIKVARGRYLAHRLAWLLAYGEPVPTNLDHIDGNRANNRIANLRAATGSQNCANGKKRMTNRSGVKGVYFDKSIGKYRVYIYINGRRTHYGTFKTLIEAAACRIEAAEKLHGDFARHE